MNVPRRGTTVKRYAKDDRKKPNGLAIKQSKPKTSKKAEQKRKAYNQETPNPWTGSKKISLALEAERMPINGPERSGYSECWRGNTKRPLAVQPLSYAVGDRSGVQLGREI